MEVNLSKQFLSSSEHDVDIIVNFFIVGDLIIYYPSIWDDALIANLRQIDLCMNQIPI